MFSETCLGSFLRSVYSGSYPELLQKESALALVTLLLADESITQDSRTKNELCNVLAAIYGDDANWRHSESPVNIAITSELAQILPELSANDYIKAEAHIAGLLGIVDESLAFAKHQRCRLIHSKALRIFHGQRRHLEPQGTNLFIGIIGLKGSGKSSVLHFFKENEDVLELYRELDRIQKECPDKFASLPSSKDDWEDQPLQLVLHQRGLTAKTRQRVFLGSLLRWSEVELLFHYGKVIFVHVESTNALRHARAKNRGRKIEKEADQSWLIELDAHRDGLWPNYEQNDLGSLIDLCGHTFINDQDSLPSNLYEQIRNTIRKEVSKWIY